MLSPEIRVVAVDPILSWRTEQVERNTILNGFRFMGEMSREVDDFPGADHDYPHSDPCLVLDEIWITAGSRDKG